MPEEVFTNLTNSGPVSVYVTDGKITRIRPLVADENDYKPWTIESGGRKFSPPKKPTLSPYIHAERRRIYSEERIRYPMKRVDFDPNGERNPQNRGKSGYERISWDEALELVSGELKRVKDTYGGSAISGLTSSHHNWGIVGYKMGPFARFMNLMEFTPVLDNPDSWEGWHWGATHTYGFFWRLGMPEPYDHLSDALQNAEMIVFWSNDPDSTRGTYSGQESSLWRQWLKELGVKMVFIDPFHNYTNAAMGGKWLAPRPGTDAAVAMAIAYVWISEDTYNKDYIANRTIGFEEFKKQVMGDADGVPKTPEWAAEESGVEARVIRALAREWAAKRTVLSGGSRSGEGGACRQAYGTEWARLMVLLQAMQGLGAPGRSIWGTTMGAPSDTTIWFPCYGEVEGKISSSTKAANLPTGQPHPAAPLAPHRARCHPRPAGELVWRGLLRPQSGTAVHPFHLPDGGLLRGQALLSLRRFLHGHHERHQQVGAHVPEPQAGVRGQPGHLVEQRDAHGRRDPAGLHQLRARRHRRVGRRERLHGPRQQRLQLPICHPREEVHRAPVGIEVRLPDLRPLAERLGLKEEFTDGKTEIDWCKAFYDASDLSKVVGWEEFDSKGYHIINIPDDYKPTPSLRWFYEGRSCDTPDLGNPKRIGDKCKELGTFSGKIEFESQSLKQYFPDDEERPVVPRYIPSWEGHRSDLAQKYPLQLMSPHPRFTFHCHYDKHTDWLDDIPVHRIKKDGYAWWPARIHPDDAVQRGINNNDLVRLYNDRGSVICVAVVTGRIRPGVIHSYASSAKYDPLLPGQPDSPDKGGCVALLTPSRMLSQNVPGMTPNSCLIEIEKWEG